VQTNCVGEVLSRYETCDESGTSRHIDSKHRAHDQRRHGQMHNMHLVGDDKDGNRQHQPGQDELSNENHSTAVETVGQHAAQGRQQQHGDRTEKRQQPQREFGSRQIEHQPALRHLLHPEGDLTAGIGLPEPGILLIGQRGGHSVADTDQRPEQGIDVRRSDKRFRPETFVHRRSVGDGRGLGQLAGTRVVDYSTSGLSRIGDSETALIGSAEARSQAEVAGRFATSGRQ